MPPLNDHDVQVLIVGSGFSGLGLGIRLKQAGIDDFVIVERAGDVGGTWRDNTYPGAACDIPSHLYSFSFAPNPDWSRAFSPQPEIHGYLSACARRFGMMPHLRFNHELLHADWDDTAKRWQVLTSGGSFTAKVLVSAAGPLSDPATPDIKGLDGFSGEVFHSARWNHDHDLAGRRVAVIGTGASAIQFVPQIAKVVGHLDLYQRTPPWIIPRPDKAVSARAHEVYRRFPAVQRGIRGALWGMREVGVPGFTRNPRFLRPVQAVAGWHMARQVPDPALRAKLRPTFTIGCKRILLASDYYPALTRPNVEVVTDSVREVLPNAIVTTDGAERPVDTIILATGFLVTSPPIAERVIGRAGRTMADNFTAGIRAFRSSTFAGFPNLFMILGPNSGLGHNSMIYMIESQINYVLDSILTMQRQGLASVEVEQAAVDGWNDWIQARMAPTVWMTGGCKSWYIDADGHNSTLWPGFTWDFRRRTRTFDADSYHLERTAPQGSLTQRG